MGLHLGIIVANPKVASPQWQKQGWLIKRQGLLLATSHLSRQDAPTHCMPPLHRDGERGKGETEAIKGKKIYVHTVIRDSNVMLKVNKGVKDTKSLIL